jgi:hypothetical protein
MRSLPHIYLDRALTRDGAKITSHIYLDHLHRVIAARAADGLLEDGAVQQEKAK